MSNDVYKDEHGNTFDENGLCYTCSHDNVSCYCPFPEEANYIEWVVSELNGDKNV